MEDIQSSLSEIAAEIKAVQTGIEALELEIKNISKAIDECKDAAEKKQLRDKEKQLRDEKKQHRDKENILIAEKYNLVNEQRQVKKTRDVSEEADHVKSFRVFSLQEGSARAPDSGALTGELLSLLIPKFAR